MRLALEVITRRRSQLRTSYAATATVSPVRTSAPSPVALPPHHSFPGLGLSSQNISSHFVRLLASKVSHSVAASLVNRPIYASINYSSCLHLLKCMTITRALWRHRYAPARPIRTRRSQSTPVQRLQDSLLMRLLPLHSCLTGFIAQDTATDHLQVGADQHIIVGLYLVLRAIKSFTKSSISIVLRLNKSQ